MRCRVHSLPYMYYPRNMIAGLVISTVKSLNNEVGACKLSKNYAPHTLITGYDIPNYEQLMDLSFGDHVEVKNLNNVTNSIKNRTIPAMALYPSGNLQGGWRMLSLSTGRLIYRSRWVKVNLTNELINKVHVLGRRQGQKEMTMNPQDTVDGEDDSSEHGSEVSEDDKSNEENVTTIEDPEDGNTDVDESGINPEAKYVNEIQPEVEDEVTENENVMDSDTVNDDETSVNTDEKRENDNIVDVSNEDDNVEDIDDTVDERDNCGDDAQDEDAAYL